MAKLTPQMLMQRGNLLFEKKQPLLALWQTIADNFYPERADFTAVRHVGAELADNLVDSYPILVRRDLGNSLHAMLRTGDWFDIGIDGKPDYHSKIWLESRTLALRKYMNDRASGFIRSTKQCDHDYVSFGQGVLSIEVNRNANGLLYRNWHLKDVAWFEDESGQVCGVYRKFAPELHQLVQYFGEGKLHPKVIERYKKEPHATHDMYHMVMPSHLYGDDEMQSKNPYVSCYIDVVNQSIVEETGLDNRFYVIPRFQTISGSQYAYSPATVVALPDARTLQAMTHTLLEAAERYARPPIIATQKVVRSDVDLNPDGITWVDDEYDERLGAALRPLTQNASGFPIGENQRERITEVLRQAFYLNKVMLPDVSHDMTAYEVAERMKEYRRQNLPLFAPIEAEYSGQVCEMSFQLAMGAGFMGSHYDIPPQLMGSDVEFKFKSPLSESDEERKINHFAQMSQMLAQAAQFDTMAVHNVNFDEALRDAITGSGAPQVWLHSPESVQQRRMVEQAVQAASTTNAQQMMEQQ